MSTLQQTERPALPNEKVLLSFLDPKLSGEVKLLLDLAFQEGYKQAKKDVTKMISEKYGFNSDDQNAYT